MKKLISFLVILLLPFLVKAQDPQPVYGDYSYPGSVLFDNGLYIPVRDTTGFAPYRVGALVILPQDTVGHPAALPIRFWNGSYWGSITGSAGNIYFGSNGLTLSGNTFKLGGALNQNTDITTAGYGLSLNSAVKNVPVFNLIAGNQRLGFRETDSTLSGFEYAPANKRGVFRFYANGVPVGVLQQGSFQLNDSSLNSYLSAGKDFLNLTGSTGAMYAQISPGNTSLSTSSGTPYAAFSASSATLSPYSNTDTAKYLTTDATGKLTLKVPAGIRAIDSALMDFPTGTISFRRNFGGYLPVFIGKPVDSLRFSTDTLYGRKLSGGEIAVKITGLPQANIIGLPDSLKARWDTIQFPAKVQYTVLDKLLAGPAIVPQPGDSLIVAIEKLIALYNSITGKYVSNQTSSYLSESFKILGSGDIQATSAAGALNLRRGSSMNYYPIVNLQTNSGTNIGYVGAGSNVDPNRIDLIALRGGTRLISSDTNSIRFGNYSVASNSRVSTGYHNLKWLMMPSFPVENDVFFDTSSLYIKTLNVYGGIKADTLDVNGIYLGGGSAGQYLTLDATGKLIAPITLPSFAPATGSANYIQNQSAAAQTSSSFWVSGSSRTNGVHSMGSSSRITGTGTGAANVALFSFRQSDNSTETGSVGDVSSGNSDIAISSTSGDVTAVAGGSVKLRVGATTAALQVSGAIILPTRTVTGTATMGTSDYTLRVNNSSNVVVNLPTAVGITGTIYVIKKVSNNGSTVTITASGSEIIDTANTNVISTYNSSLIIQSNGTGWDII